MIKTKILNFTAVEILPALLNKTKIQTLRPGWKYGDLITNRCCPDSPHCDCKKEYIMLNKPARFSVGEKITLMWNQRSKFEYFCVKCGKGVYSCGDYFSERECCKGNTQFFQKYIGEAVITEVFKIEMDKNPNSITNVSEFGITSSNRSAIDFEGLAKKDGFKSSKNMFKWFDERYNLSKPKPFWVYRWHWVLYAPK